MKNKLLALLVVIMFLSIVLFGAAQINGTLTNYQVKGWLFGKDAQFAGERTWAKTDTLDTLVVTGVDTTCAVFLQAKTTVIKGLTYDIRSAGDSIFVESDSTGAATEKYSYLIVRNAYGATD
jgi:hypothetical protein